MKEIKNARIKEESSAHMGRWRQNTDGTYQYIGISQFKRVVCAIMNIYAIRKAAQMGA